MRYAVTWTKNFEYFNEVDEVIFHYKGDGDLYEIISNTLTREDQVANININDYFDLGTTEEDNIQDFINIVLKIKQEYQVMVSLNFYSSQRAFVEDFKNNDIPFMFTTVATNLSILKAMQLVGASEIIIAEDLGFSLDKVQDVRNAGARIRVYPDVAQVAYCCDNILPKITNFWIRPEDTELYEQYVDTFELCHIENQSTIFKIYKQQQWKGNLRGIILDYEESLENSSITPHFGQMRLTCGKQCLLGRCNICFRMQELAKQFDKANIGIVKEKKEFKKNELTDNKEPLLHE